MEVEFLDILKKKVKPSLRCAGSISVTFTTNIAKDAVEGNPQKIRIIVDKCTYKNFISAVTSSIDFKGALESSV